MATLTLKLAVAAVAVLLGLILCVQSAPRLYEDQQEVSDEPLYAIEPVEVLASDVLPLTRTRRGSDGHGSGHGHNQGWGWQPVGPVFTYVRTDYHGNFQWGVRHKAGGHGWHGR